MCRALPTQPRIVVLIILVVNAVTVGASSGHAQRDHSQDLIRLDFSGSVRINILGPSDVIDTALPPPFLVRPGHLSMLFGLDYDFAKSWSGAKSLRNTLRFWAPSRHVHPMRRVIDLSWNQNVHNHGASSAELTCFWESSQKNQHPGCTPFLKLKAAVSGDRSAVVSLPFFKRLKWVGCMQNYDRIGSGIGENKDAIGGTTRSGDEWWIPEVRIDALGQLESKNQAYISNNQMRLAFKIKRRLNWTAFGNPDDGPLQETTKLHFEIKRVSLNFKSTDTFSIDTVLEQPIQSAQFSIRQDITMR